MFTGTTKVHIFTPTWACGVCLGAGNKQHTRGLPGLAMLHTWGSLAWRLLAALVAAAAAAAAIS